MSVQLRSVVRVLRTLLRTPLFTVVAVVTLAVGIGANAAVFAVLKSVLLDPLPFDEPDRLVGVWHTAPGLNFEEVNLSPGTYYTYREDARVFEDVGLWDNATVSVTGLDEPEQVEAMMLTDGTLPLLRVRPVLGRAFTREDDSAGAAPTVILGHGYWQSRLGGDRSVLGRTLTIQGRPHEVIGVMPPGRFLDFDPALYLPFRWDRAAARIDNFSYQGVARLRAGATLEQANAEIGRLIPVAVERFPSSITIEMLREARFGPLVRPLERDVVGDVGGLLWVLFGTVGLVLLIACANVANLFLVRAEGRQQEMAVRTALGAGRARIAREFLGESMALALIGGVAGIALAFAGIRLLVALAPEGLPRLESIRIDAQVVLFTFGISVLAGAAFGSIPALRYHGPQLTLALREGGRGGSAGRARHRTRNALVVSQMALALVLIAAAGLMVRSFQALRRVDPGFDRPAEVLTVRVAIPAAQVEEPAEVAVMFESIRQRIADIPGVSSVGTSSSITMDRRDNNSAVVLEDFPTPEGSLPPIRRFKFISPGYTETMGNPLLAGRAFTWGDIHQRARVAMVTEDMAREFWGSAAAAVGRRVRGGLDGPWRTIVGVVGTEHDDGVTVPAVPIVYWPMAIDSFFEQELFIERSMAFALRSPRTGSVGLLEDVRAAVWSVNPNLPLQSVQTLEELHARSMARTSFTLVMLGIAAGMALLLGAVGLYGVISYIVSQRTREIGVRVALGAQRADVTRLVLRLGLLLSGAGVLLGLIAAAVLTRLMGALLFGVRPLDPISYGAGAAGLALVALLASYLPARRALRVDPVQALRSE